MTSQPATPLPRATPDPIVSAYQADLGVVDRLRACQLALAFLVVELEWLEQHADEVDDLVEAGRAASRRVRAIKSVVRLELDVQRLRGEPEPDLRSPVAHQVFSAFVDQLEDTTREMVAKDVANDIFTDFKAKVKANPDIPWP